MSLSKTQIQDLKDLWYAGNELLKSDLAIQKFVHDYATSLFARNDRELKDTFNITNINPNVPSDAMWPLIMDLADNWESGNTNFADFSFDKDYKQKKAEFFKLWNDCETKLEAFRDQLSILFGEFDTYSPKIQKFLELVEAPSDDEDWLSNFTAFANESLLNDFLKEV